MKFTLIWIIYRKWNMQMSYIFWNIIVNKVKYYGEKKSKSLLKLLQTSRLIWNDAGSWTHGFVWDVIHQTCVCYLRDSGFNIAECYRDKNK